MVDEGIGAVSVAEAFSPDDDRNEQTVVQIAREVGLPACASTELSGLYGLELRAVTAAVNASILPIADPHGAASSSKGYATPTSLRPSW